jgi:hypothetical protein
MLLYSTREIRRSGDQSTVGVPPVQRAVLLMSAVLSGPGAGTPAEPPSSAVEA